MRILIGALVFASALALSSVVAHAAEDAIDAATRSALASASTSAAKPTVREPNPADVAKMLATEQAHLRAVEEAVNATLAAKAGKPKEPPAPK